MDVEGQPYRTIWPAADGVSVEVIDQRRLPHEFVTLPLRTLDEVVLAIRDMAVRGAPLIGAAAAFGVALALRADPTDAGLRSAVARLIASRPTAVNLAWAARSVAAVVGPLPLARRFEAAMGKPSGSVKTMSPAAVRSAPTAHACWPPWRRRTGRCRCSPTATPGGSRPWTGALHWRRSTRRTDRACRSTCGSMKPGRATRAPC